jgi:hypothetical protein
MAIQTAPQTAIQTAPPGNYLKSQMAKVAEIDVGARRSGDDATVGHHQENIMVLRAKLDEVSSQQKELESRHIQLQEQ